MPLLSLDAYATHPVPLPPGTVPVPTGPGLGGVPPGGIVPLPPGGVMPPPPGSVVPLPPGGVMPPAPGTISGQQFVANPTGYDPMVGQQGNTATLATDIMGQILDSNNPYIADARRRGMEVANSRGLMNSSIAAGEAQRSATEAAMPMFQSAFGLVDSREGRALTTQENQLDRIQGVNNALLGETLGERMAGVSNRYDQSNMSLQNKYAMDQAQQGYGFAKQLQSDGVKQKDWLSSQDYTRQLNATLQLMPIQNTADMQKSMLDLMGANPDVWTPNNVAGVTNFFQNNMKAMMAQMFPSYFK